MAKRRKATSRILLYNRKKGFGFIAPDNEDVRDSIFMKEDLILEEGEIVKKGQLVDFILVENGSGLFAKEIYPIEKYYEDKDSDVYESIDEFGYIDDLEEN